MWLRFKLLAASSLAVTAACTAPAEYPRTCGKPDFILSSKNLIVSDSGACSFRLADRHISSDNDDWKFSLRARERIAQSPRPTDTDPPQVADRGATPGPSDGASSKDGAGSNPNDAGPRAETGTNDPSAEDTAVDAGGVGSVGSGSTSDSASNDSVASSDPSAAGATDDGSAVGGATDEASQTPGGEESDPNTDANSGVPIGSSGGNGGTKGGGGGSVSNNGNGNGSEGASPGKGKGANDDEV